MAYLAYISDEDLVLTVGKVIDKIESAERDIEKKLHKNVIDPFSALFDGITHNISYDEWIKMEKVRQVQKTMQMLLVIFIKRFWGVLPIARI